MHTLQYAHFFLPLKAKYYVSYVWKEDRTFSRVNGMHMHCTSRKGPGSIDVLSGEAVHCSFHVSAGPLWCRSLSTMQELGTGVRTSWYFAYCSVENTKVLCYWHFLIGTAFIKYDRDLWVVSRLKMFSTKMENLWFLSIWCGGRRGSFPLTSKLIPCHPYIYWHTVKYVLISQ